MKRLGHAIAASTLSSQTITATLPATISFCTLFVFSISGANTASALDGSAVSGVSPQSITTTNANDMIVAGWGTNSSASPSAGACCTLIKSGQFQGTQFVKKTSTGSYSIDAPDARGMVVMAIKSN